MTGKPTLSVVLTNFNHGRYLPQALGAILSQSRKPDEVIVIDDASTDDSCAIIGGFAREHACIRALYNEKNCGVVPNANRGLSMASGSHVFFAAADDFILPGFFEKLMAAADRCPEVGLVTSDQAFLPEDQDHIRTVSLPLGREECCIDGPAITRVLRAQPFSIGGHVSLIRRDAAMEAGSLLPELRWHCDWFMNHVVAFRYGLAYVPEALSVMRVAATTYSGRNIHSWQSQQPVLTALADLLCGGSFADVREPFAHSGILIAFDPYFIRLAFHNRNALSLLRPIMVKRALLNFAERRNLQKFVPGPIRAVRRAWIAARLRTVVSSLDTHT